MTPLRQRRRRAEVMDGPGLDPARHARALRGLARLNFLSRSANTLWHPLESFGRDLGTRRLRVLDVATGAGDVPVRLWERARRAGLDWEIAGCDVSPVAVEHARARAHSAGADVSFFVADALEGPPWPDYDAVVCSLFLHHLDEDQACTLLRRMAALPCDPAEAGGGPSCSPLPRSGGEGSGVRGFAGVGQVANLPSAQAGWQPAPPHRPSPPAGVVGQVSNLTRSSGQVGNLTYAREGNPSAGPRLVLVNDLVRSVAGLALAFLASRLFSASRVVHTDAVRSVEGAFTPDEVRALAERAGLRGATVERRWPCRYLLSWRRT